MIPLSTNIKQKYNLIYFKLIELKGLLKEKLEECHVDWEACINDPNNDITAELLAENKASFTQLIKCLVHIDSYAPHKEITDYNGYQIHNNSVTYLDETNSDYYQNKTIHTKDYILIDKIYYYMSFLRWFLREMNVSQYDINEARTLKALILLLDKVTIYENIEFIAPTNENDEIVMYTDIQNSLNYYFISSKTQEEVNIPLYTLQCTSENNNVSFMIIDVQTMNWRLVDNESHRVGDYYEIDFCLEADHDIPDEQLNNIYKSYSLSGTITRKDKNKIRIYYGTWAEIDDSIPITINIPQKIVNHKLYDNVRVVYQSDEYNLTYPNGKHETGVFIKPVINENLPQDIECTLTFNGYQQYKPLTTDFTITVYENPFIMDPVVIKNNNDTSIYYESEDEGYRTDEWLIYLILKNYKNEPIISKEIYLQIEDEEPFTEPLITDMNGYAYYIGTIPYFNSDFIEYENYNMPDAIKFFIRDGDIDFEDSTKLYYENTNESYQTVVTQPLMQSEIEGKMMTVGQDNNNNPITKLFYYYVFDENHKYLINFDTSQTLVLGEEYEIQYPAQKNDLALKIYTTGDPVHDTSVIKKINLYHQPVDMVIQSTSDDIYVGSEITILITFYNILTGQPLDEHIYDGEKIQINIEGNKTTHTVTNSQVSYEYTITDSGVNEIVATIHYQTDEQTIISKEYTAFNKGEVILDGDFISQLQN